MCVRKYLSLHASIHIHVHGSLNSSEKKAAEFSEEKSIVELLCVCVYASQQ